MQITNSLGVIKYLSNLNMNPICIQHAGHDSLTDIDRYIGRLSTFIVVLSHWGGDMNIDQFIIVII